MAIEHDRRRRQEDSKMRTFWHDQIPAWLPICGSIVVGFSTCVWVVSAYYTGLNKTISEMRYDLNDVKEQHAMMIENQALFQRNQDRMMIWMKIPLDPHMPTYYPVQPNIPDAKIDLHLMPATPPDKKSSLESEPVIGSMQAPPPPQEAGTNRTSW